MAAEIKRDEVLKIVRDALSDILEIEPDTISEGQSFADDLEADSLALIELVEALEEALSDRVDGFRIEEVLGRGGMGVVYRATELALHRSVAFKVLPDNLAEDEEFIYHKNLEYTINDLIMQVEELIRVQKNNDELKDILKSLQEVSDFKNKEFINGLIESVKEDILEISDLIYKKAKSLV